VYLFQDGPPAGEDGSKQAECVRVFQEIFPSGNVMLAESNIGVALNFDRAEKKFFEELNSEYAFFFEDDLILNKFYIEALEQMTQFALEDDRIAYVSAYGDHRASLETQKNRQGDVIAMGHKWGFCLTQR